MILNTFINIIIIIVIIILVIIAVRIMMRSNTCSCCDNKCSCCKSKEQLILRKPSKKNTRQLKKVRQELIDSNSLMAGTSELEKYSNIKEWLLYLKRKETEAYLPKGKVPSSLYILIRKIDNKILGFIDIRHYLNDYLLKYGGHIRYSIRPSERNKGYGNLILKEGLKYCKQMGLDKVLVTCVEGNIASEKNILNNNGKYESMNFLEEDNINIKRFWITV